MKRLLPWLLLALAVVGCYLPWVWHPAAGLSPNIYDLAEWVSLHPLARTSTPPLLTSFLLRTVFGLLAVIIALQAGQLERRKARWAAWLAALVLGLTLFPPLEFFVSARDDANYRQQFVLGSTTVVLVIVLALGNSRIPAKAKGVAAGIAALVAAVLGVWGLAQAADMVRALGIPFTPGSGVILLVCSLGLFSVERLREVLKT